MGPSEVFQLMPEAEGMTWHPPVSENTALGGGSSFQSKAEPWNDASRNCQESGPGKQEGSVQSGLGVWGGGGALSVHFSHPARPPAIW